MRFDDSQLKRAFNELSKNSLVKGKSLVDDQMDYFQRKTWKLSWAIAPTKATLDAINEKLGHRLKWRKGKKSGANFKNWSNAKELAARKRARGTFSRGWKKTQGKENNYVIQAVIYNAVGYAEKVEERTKVADIAAAQVTVNYQKKLDKMCEKLLEQF